MATHGEEPTQARQLCLDDLADGTIGASLSWLALCDMAGPTLCSKRLSAISAADEIWKPLCERRWRGFFRHKEWLAAASEAAAARSPGAQQVGLWKGHFVSCEGQRTHPALGVFCMRARLRIGRPFGMHWFEPRYRWLAQRCVDEHGSESIPSRNAAGRHRLMCYAPDIPQEGAKGGFICEMQEVQITADGRANVELLPVATCQFNSVWSEAVPEDENAPRLMCASVLELGTGKEEKGPFTSKQQPSEGATDGAAAADDDDDGDDDDDDDDDDNGMGGQGASIRQQILRTLFMHAQANGHTSIGELLEGPNTVPEGLLRLLAMVNEAGEGGGGGGRPTHNMDDEDEDDEGLDAGGGDDGEEEEEEEEEEEAGWDAEGGEGKFYDEAPSPLRAAVVADSKGRSSYEGWLSELEPGAVADHPLLPVVWDEGGI